MAPVQHIKELTIGLEGERASLVEGLAAAHQAGGAVRAVIGEYGFGKTHLVELTAQEALERNFLVATTSLDLGEAPAHRAVAIYSSLLRGLRYPDSDERGLEPLIDKALAVSNWRGHLWSATTRGQRSAGRGAVRHRRDLVGAAAQGLARVADGRPAHADHGQGPAARGQVPQHLHRGPQRPADRLSAQRRQRAGPAGRLQRAVRA